MNTKVLLDQLLRSGSEILQSQSQGGRNSDPRKNSNIDILARSSDVLSSLVSGRGGALLAGGGLVALGALAHKAYKNHPQNSSNQSAQQAVSLERLPQIEAETHCRGILIALIAASKADGHIDDRERQLIETEVAKLTSDSSVQQWFDKELRKPLDPAEVAQHATNQLMTAEMYLASLVAIDEQNFMEKSYLDELARQMKIPPALQAELAQQARQAMSAVEQIPVR